MPCAGHCGPCGNKETRKTENSACPTDVYINLRSRPLLSPPHHTHSPPPLLSSSFFSRLLPPSPFRLPRGDLVHRFFFLYDFVYAHSHTRTRSTTSFFRPSDVQLHERVSRVSRVLRYPRYPSIAQSIDCFSLILIHFPPQCALPFPPLLSP